MSRCVFTTTLAGAALLVIGVFTEGAERWWLAGAVAAGYLVVFTLGVTFIRMEFFHEATCHGKPACSAGKSGGMRIALTFDDGPDPAATPALLDVLRRHGAPATFFCIGAKVVAHPDLVRRIAQEGHVVGNHTFHHAWWTNFLFGRRLQEEVERAQKAIQEVLGVRPRYFRSPMGLTNPHFEGAMRRAGLVFVGWDAGRFDRGPRPQAVVRRVLRRARDGSILLLHEGNVDPAALVAKVDALITHLRGRGYSFVRLEEFSIGPAYSRVSG